MTILQILPELNDGGVERGTVEMAEYIHKQGAKSLVASAGGSRVFSVIAAGAKHYELPLQRKNPLSLLLNAWRLRQLAAAEGVTHMHARSRGPAWSGWLATRFSSVKFITTFHGTHSLKGIGKKLYNSVMVRGDVVVANSAFIAEHIQKHYAKILGDRPFLLAPRGADTAIFRPDATSAAEQKKIRAACNMAASDILVVQVGRISRWKGQAVLIEALAGLDKNVHLALVGASDTKNDDYLQELKALAADLGIAPRVHFVGSRSDVAAWYNTADIAVNASLKPEAFGRTTAESMASGTFTIATAHGGSLEIIEDNKSGILVPPNDVLALTDALKRSVDNKTAQKRIAAAGVKRIQENFTIQTMCEKEFAAYDIQ